MVDSSVWIDYFNGNNTVASEKLDSLLGVKPICIGDLILTEVLQGFKSDKDYIIAKSLLTTLPIYTLLGQELSLKCADNFRLLRKKGITVRKTIDVIIATYCIEHNKTLLHSDKDFLPFEQYFGLRAY
jgi:predicted nucleic acid-binding protein